MINLKPVTGGAQKSREIDVLRSGFMSMLKKAGTATVKPNGDIVMKFTD